MSYTSLLNSPWLHKPVKRSQCFILSLNDNRSKHCLLPIRRVRVRFLPPRVSRFKVDACWIPSNEISRDEFGGWLTDAPEIMDRNGWRKYVFIGIAAPVVMLLAGLTYYACQRKGIRYSIPVPFISFEEKSPKFNEDSDTREIEASQDSESKQDESSNASLDKLKETFFSDGYRVAITVPADTAQENALSVLRKLQIIENDANADELCTRREFARWFVKLSSSLERSRTHKIAPSVLVAESVISAFDDVEINDPDFWSIQCLGEAGIVPSKLSSVNSSSSNSYFLPESYLSRFDMLNWKALVEYATIEIDKKIINKKATVLDLSACPGVSAPLLTDLLSGESSIFSRVFGNTRLIRPYKPVTKAQAAVALTSGRMEKLIHEELTRIEVEAKLKLSDMEDIKQELIQKGEIEKFWKARIEMEREKEMKRQEALESVLVELRRERKEREEGLSENMKEKIALDGERAILLGLKREIDELSERIIDENNQVTREKSSVEKIYVDVNGKYESLIETKSRLEAEKEAVHVLRSWVEEEANRLQGRVKILEEAIGRWRFNGNEDSVGRVD